MSKRKPPTGEGKRLALGSYASHVACVLKGAERVCIWACHGFACRMGLGDSAPHLQSYTI